MVCRCCPRLTTHFFPHGATCNITQAVGAGTCGKFFRGGLVLPYVRLLAQQHTTKKIGVGGAYQTTRVAGQDLSPPVPSSDPHASLRDFDVVESVTPDRPRPGPSLVFFCRDGGEKLWRVSEF